MTTTTTRPASLLDRIAGARTALELQACEQDALHSPDISDADAIDAFATIAEHPLFQAMLDLPYPVATKGAQP